MIGRPHRRGRGGKGGHEPRARIQNRAIRAMELSIRGQTQHAIARELGISQAAVSKMRHRLESRIYVELARVRGRQKAVCSLRLEHLYGQAIQAWERSQRDMTRKLQRMTQGGAQGGATVAELVTENEHGDPRYLEEARKALADLTKLWGLDAPYKVEVRANTPRQDLSGLSLPELSKRADDIARRIRERCEKDVPLVQAPFSPEAVE
jgi:predicted transcriptional regulator